MQGFLAERGKHVSTALGVILIVLGAIALLLPSLLAAWVVTRVITWLVIFTAIEQALYAYQTRGEGGLFLKVLLAVLYAVAGGLLLGRPVSGVIAVTAVLGFLFIADGITEIALGAQLRHTYDARTGWLFAGGILSVVLGALIVLGLPRSIVALGLFVGIRLIFKGSEHIVRSSAGAKIEHIGERRAA